MVSATRERIDVKGTPSTLRSHKASVLPHHFATHDDA